MTSAVQNRHQLRRRAADGITMTTLAGMLLCASIPATTSFAAETAAVSCERDLTCMRETKVADEQKFSAGPNLTEWRLSAGKTCPSLLRTGAHDAPDSLQDAVTSMKFMLIPGACYQRENLDGQTHEVCLDPYYLGIYEVTFAEYDQFARATGRELPDDEGWGRGRRPVINVSVYDALNFAKWLSRKTGAHYRMPTEFEWEHAARAGSATLYPWGNALGQNRANCVGCGSQWDDEQTAPVGSFAPNAWGLYDVIGNVAEWTCSMRDPDPAHSFARCDSIYETRRRAYRNGAWSDDPDRLGTAFRDWNVAIRRTDDVGFRLLVECHDCRNEGEEAEAQTLAKH
jgi:formylglycine-generating enzyme required for sulfatase activity